MTKEVVEVQTPARREQIRTRLNQLRQSRKRKVLGVAEIAGLAGAGLMLFLALISYFYFLSPAHVRLDALERERARLQTQFRTAQEGFQHNTDTKTAVETINASLEQFESGHLVARATGRMALYAELNQLIRSNKLRNTAGPTYGVLAPLGTRESRGESTEQGNARWQSVFPGIGVSVTVEGPYQNLRHFLRDIEASRQFLIINTVELETTNEFSVATPADGEAGPARQKAGVVSLRLDMATYFQRGATESAPRADEGAH
jgi:Tfp pilus assembly protein PilO